MSVLYICKRPKHFLNLRVSLCLPPELGPSAVVSSGGMGRKLTPGTGKGKGKKEEVFYV